MDQVAGKISKNLDDSPVVCKRPTLPHPPCPGGAAVGLSSPTCHTEGSDTSETSSISSSESVSDNLPDDSPDLYRRFESAAREYVTINPPSGSAEHERLRGEIRAAGQPSHIRLSIMNQLLSIPLDYTAVSLIGRTQWHYSALHWAAMIGSAVICEILLSSGRCEDINGRTVNLRTPLMAACKPSKFPTTPIDSELSNRPGVVNLLISYGADLHMMLATLSRVLNQRARASYRTSVHSSQEEEEDIGLEWTPDDEGDDTDLEIEVEEVKRRSCIDHSKVKDGNVGVKTYESICRDIATPVSTAIVRGLPSESIRIPTRSLGPKHLTGLTCALMKNTWLNEVDLSNNSLGYSGGREVAVVLTSHCFVTKVNLSMNHLGGCGVSTFIAQLLIKNKIITRLNLSHNGFNDEDGKYLASGIGINDCVTQLDLSHNKFCEGGGSLIGKAIGANDTIEELDLSWNHIRKKGAIILGKGLKNNWALRVLDLSWNGRCYEGALGIRDALKGNRNLKELDISNNRINWEGALLLATGLEANTTLEVLKAGHNPLTTTGCQDMIDAISDNSSSSLKMLDLSSVPVVQTFEAMSKQIGEQRQFVCCHGGVVPHHDVLGERSSRKIHPMQKIVNFMYVKELRPVELMRAFDKEVTFELTKDNFFERLLAAGVDLRIHEMDELSEYVCGDPDADTFGYKQFIDSVADHIEKERNLRLDARRKKMATKQFQRNMLSKAKLPSIDVEKQLEALTGLDSAGDGAEGTSSRRFALTVMSASLSDRATNSFNSKMCIAKNIDKYDPNGALATPILRRGFPEIRPTNSARVIMSSPLNKVKARRSYVGLRDQRSNRGRVATTAWAAPALVPVPRSTTS